MYLSEALIGGKLDYDKSFIKTIASSANTSKGFMPLYTHKGRTSSVLSIVLNNSLDNYDAFVRIYNKNDQFNVDVGKISFSVTLEKFNKEHGKISVNGSKTYSFQNKDVNTFRVTSKDGITYAYANSRLLAKYNKTIGLRGISISLKNGSPYDGQSYSDVLHDIGITELISN